MGCDQREAGADEVEGGCHVRGASGEADVGYALSGPAPGTGAERVQGAGVIGILRVGDDGGGSVGGGQQEFVVDAVAGPARRVGGGDVDDLACEGAPLGLVGDQKGFAACPAATAASGAT